MLTYTITGDNITIDEKARGYIEKRFSKFERFLTKEETGEVSVTASRVTAHTRENTFMVEVQFRVPQGEFFVRAENRDLFKAVDEAKDELSREFTKSKDKKETLFYRSARTLKNFAKGIYRFRRK